MHLLSGFLASAFVLTLGLPGSIFASNPNIIISYNQQRDNISIQAQDASLTTVLSDVAKKTNITIRIDPAVEKTVNFQLPPQSLQQALQKIVKGLSYIIEYKTDAQQQTVVSGLRLLPKGIQDSGQLVPVSVLNARASRSGRGDGEGNDDDSLNHRDDYQQGSRQTRIIRRPKKQPAVLRPATSDQDNTATPSEIAAGQNNNQQAEPQPKKRLNNPEINSADIFQYEVY